MVSMSKGQVIFRASTTFPTEYYYEGEQVSKQQEFRNALATAIENEFRNLINHTDKKVQVKTWLHLDRTGPMGGTSAQVTAAVDIDGIVFPVAINVYCDHNIADHVERLVEQEQENDRLREKLGFSPPSNQIEA